VYCEPAGCTLASSLQFSFFRCEDDLARAKSDQIVHLFALFGTHKHALVLHLSHSTDRVNKSGSGHAWGRITLTGGRVAYVGITLNLYTE